MKLTKSGTDYVVVTEENINDKNLLNIPKIHIIKLLFKPNNIKECVNLIINNFPSTRRFVIEDNIKIYNYLLKRTSKKFYVENKKGDSLISFFRKNNKVLLNFQNLNKTELDFIKENIDDVLFNVEVVNFGDLSDLLQEFNQNLSQWKGNVIINGS